MGGIGRQVLHHLPGRSDACHEQHMVVRKLFQGKTVLNDCLVPEHGLQGVVAERGEIEVLVGKEIHGLGDDAESHGFEFLRALGNDNHVGTVLAIQGLAQSSGRQQLVVDDETMIVHEQDIDAGLDVAVLEGIVEQHDVDATVDPYERLDAMHALLVDRHDGLGEFQLHLHRLVSNVACRRTRPGQHEALRLALIAPAEYGHLGLMLQQLDEILDMRGLTSAAHGDVAHRDDGHAEVAALHDSHVKEEIPDAHTQPVEPAQRQQPLIDFDEITLHLIIE